MIRAPNCQKRRLTMAITGTFLVTTIPLTASSCTWVNATTGAVDFPAGITEIRPQAFEGCATIQSAVIPNTVIRIGHRAFSNSTVHRVTVSDSVERVDFEAFFNCTELVDIEFGRSVSRIGYGALRRCTVLQSVVFHSNLSALPVGCLDECNHLEVVTWPGWIASIGPNISTHCGLEDLDLPGTITSIGAWAFAFCRRLRTATIRANPDLDIGPNALAETPCWCCTPEMLNRTCNCAVECDQTPVGLPSPSATSSTNSTMTGLIIAIVLIVVGVGAAAVVRVRKTFRADAVHFTTPNAAVNEPLYENLEPPKDRVQTIEYV